MASFAAQAALRSKWTDLVESSSFEVPGEVSSGVRSVVGWLKQVRLGYFILFHLCSWTRHGYKTLVLG